MNYQVRPEFADEWMDHVVEFAAAIRAEASNKRFKWPRSVEDPDQYILVGAFDDDTGEVHANSEYFAKGLEAMKSLLAEIPKAVLQILPDKQDWDCMDKLQVD